MYPTISSIPEYTEDTFMSNLDTTRPSHYDMLTLDSVAVVR